MNKNITQAWFTLIEIIVSVTIFGIIMVSVMSIFLFSSQMSQRVELNRVMQENIKSVVEDIAEEVRKGNILDISTDSVSSCDANFTSSDSGSKLCLEWGINYMLWYKDTSTWDWVRVSNISDCLDYIEDDESVCRVIKNKWAWDYFPLTNSFIAVEKLDFTLTNEELPKVTVMMTVRPAFLKGVQPDVVEANRMSVQTTVSERLIQTD